MTIQRSSPLDTEFVMHRSFGVSIGLHCGSHSFDDFSNSINEIPASSSFSELPIEDRPLLSIP